MNCNFEYIDKSKLKSVLPHLFKILHDNMSWICPTENEYEKDYKTWFSNVFPAVQKPQRQIILIYCEKKLCGYFQYYVNSDTFMMEEIQIKKEYQQKGIFPLFFSWLIHQLPNNIENVEAYAHKNNIKSQGILEHLGLKRIGETNDGMLWHFKGEYRSLLDRYL